MPMICFIGHGNFGAVKKGQYTLPSGKQISVAVKTLKEEDLPGQKVRFCAFFSYEKNFK